jgi:hypothetical protein
MRCGRERSRSTPEGCRAAACPSSFGVRWSRCDDVGFHPDTEVVRIAGCEWWQDVRQQLLRAKRADYTVWTGLCPAVLLFAVALCPAVFGRDVDRAFSVLHLGLPFFANHV